MKPEQIVEILKDSVKECGRIHTAQGHECTGCDMLVHGVDCQRHLAARNLIAARAVEPEWVPLKEKMPDNGQRVLRYHGLAFNPKISLAFYYSGDEKGYGWCDVTHWCPIALDSPKEV